MSAPRLVTLLLSIALIASAHAGDAEDIAASLARGQADDALQTADKALIKAPRDARLRLLRGNALAQLGRTPEAIQTFSALTSDFPNLPEPYNNLAALYAQQGQLDKARTTLQMALQTNPAYATAHANLADVYAKLAAQSYDKALQRDVVERQNGQTPAPASPATPRLQLVQDLVGGSASAIPATKPPSVTVLATATNSKAPALVASTKPPEIKSQPAAPVVIATAPKTPVVTVPTSTGKPAASSVVAATKPATAPNGGKPAEINPAPAKPDATKDAAKEAESQVLASVHGWAEAWSQKRVSAYLGSYAKSYKPAGSSRSEWEKQRRERIEAARKIDVRLDNVRIKMEGEIANVRFVQRYKSDRLDTSASKTLVLEKNGSRWLIKEERVG